MYDAVIILAGVLAVLVILNHLIRIHVESQSGRPPVIDTMDVMLLILSIAVLLSIASVIRLVDCLRAFTGL